MMCGRYVRRSDKQAISEAFHLGRLPPDFVLPPSYNVAPQSTQPVIRLDRETGARELAMMRWGLIPFFAKDAKIGYRSINARAESVTTSPVFREAMKRRRCLVPADMFYEWRKISVKLKQPYAFGLTSGRMFAFAGLWERWKDKTTGQPLESYTIITTEPNELTATVHDRMPVILKPSDYDRWLTRNDDQPPVDLLRPYDADLMAAWMVDPRVGNVKNDEPGLCDKYQCPPNSA